MEVGFDNIYKHVIPIEEFRLQWRFTEEKYDKLPKIHLEQLKPLNEQASRFLWDIILDSGMHAKIPFKDGFFNTVDRVRILESNQKEIKKWLYQRAIPFDKNVFLSWQPNQAMIVPWKLLIKYFDSFYYGSSDDLTIIDQSLNWTLLFFHEDEIYFGTNQKFKVNKSRDNIDLIW